MKTLAVAERRRVADAAQRLHEPVAADPVARLPALLLHGLRRRARAGAATCPASTSRRATRRSSSCSCCCSRPRSAASSPASGSRATSRAGSRGGCCSRRRTASGSCSATRSPALVRWFVTVALLTAVALAVGMQVGGSGVDLFGLYALGVIVNVAALLWAAGVAMRLRTMQAGPIMQMPVFLVLFFAPVYVPLSLLQGWIHARRGRQPADARARGGPRLSRRRADRGGRRLCRGDRSRAAVRALGGPRAAQGRSRRLSPPP